MNQDPLIGTQLGQYRIESVIGKGGMATVYKGIQSAVNRVVAVKVLPSSFMHDDAFMSRFRQEAEVAAQLEHIRILPVYDYGEQESTPFIVMRYIDGGTLRDKAQEDMLEPEETCRIVSQVAEALDYAHAREVIHRDLKPSNIMLDTDGNVYLADFGTAKLRDRSAHLTGSGIVGTPAYMAPEQSMPGQISPSVDIYALGVLLFELLTGQVPYSAETPIVQILMHIQHPIPSLREYNPLISPHVEAVVHKAMAKHPGDRYSTASELANALCIALRDTYGWKDNGVVTAHKSADEPTPVTPVGVRPVNSLSEIMGTEAATPSQVPVDVDQLGSAYADQLASTDVRDTPNLQGSSRTQVERLSSREGGGSGLPDGEVQATRYSTPHARPFLTAQDGTAFELKTDNILIGRSDPRRGIFVDIDLTDMDQRKRTSRSHARILEREGIFFIWDLHSMNGTYINGERLPEGGRRSLNNGDQVQFGKDGGVVLSFTW